jgi:hypothetical protein
MYRKLLALILSALFIFAAIVWGWRQFSSDARETAYAVSDYITARSIGDLVHQSELIALGTVAKVADVHFNTARNPRDPSQPASDLFITGTIYEIQVERYLKGSGGTDLRIVQSEDISLPNESGEVPTIHISESFVPLEVGVRYLFFLKTMEPYPDSPFSHLYRGTAEPYRFRLEEGVAKPETPSRLGGDLFPAMKEDTLLQQVSMELAK